MERLSAEPDITTAAHADTSIADAPVDPRVMDALHRVWGYDSLRPMQAAAIAAGLAKRDALVVMPTGGGKSLCYQVPPLVEQRTDVVVSPLIALMKDQVDGLTQLGYPAAALHSGLDNEERRAVERGVREGRYRLLFVAPERLVTPWFLETVHRLGVGAIAVDEAHCISQWGHDFRPEYRQLALLREKFPKASLHAYTATATPRVREDIVQQLRLREPDVLVGRFDRANLTYRVLPQVDLVAQTVEVLRRHRGEAAIVYCLSRKDTESLTAALRAYDINAEHYHAGMNADDRRATQERFASEQTDVIVATVAFGMGIDRGNVRAVVHACLPKSVENYQQETGRAGRDGLPAECVLLYSPADGFRLERLIKLSHQDMQDPVAAQASMDAQRELLRGMQQFASTPRCRHAMLSEYFGQPYEPPEDHDSDHGSCNACDTCLGEVEGVEDATVAAQMILSCVARVDQRFGVGHVVDVLAGSNAQKIVELGHHELSVHGLMKSTPRKTIQSYVYQLVDQELLVRAEGDRPTLSLNAASLEVMRGERQVQLIKPKSTGGSSSRSARNDAEAWEGVDRGMFEALRELRRELASKKGVPAYTVFHDRTLMDIARVRPTSRRLLGQLHGIGEAKLNNYADAVLETVKRYGDRHGLDTDLPAVGATRRPDPPESNRKGNGGSLSPAKAHAARLFEQGKSVEEVAQATARAVSTVNGYLVEWAAQTRPASIRPWVDEPTETLIRQAIRPDDEELKPIFERLNHEVPYDTIRLVIAQLSTQ